jgi:hypothetical protein
LNDPAYGCRINNQKELHFLFGARLPGNNEEVRLSHLLGSKIRAVTKLKQRILNLSEVGDKAASSAIWGPSSLVQAPSRDYGGFRRPHPAG